MDTSAVIMPPVIKSNMQHRYSSSDSNYNKHKIFIRDALKVVPNGKQNNFVLMNMLRHSDAVTACHCDVLQLCRFCGNNYYDQKHFELVPPPKLNRFVKRLQKENFAKTRYQLTCIKKIKSSYQSQTIIKTCNFCNNKRRNDVLKPVVVHAEKEFKKRFKKNRQKLKKITKFAGLNEVAVLSAKNQNTINAFTPKRGNKEDSIIVLDTPQNKNINNSPILLDTPLSGIGKKNKRILDIVNLITPVTTNNNFGSITRTPKRSSKNISVTPISKNNIPSFVTPKSTKKKKAKNKILAIDPNKKVNTRNSLANLLKDNNKANQTNANLGQFLKSIS